MLQQAQAKAPFDLKRAVAFESGKAPDRAVISFAMSQHDTLANTLSDSDPIMANWNQVIQLDPKNIDALINRGCYLGLIGSYDKARADLDQAIALDPKEPRAFANRARILSFKAISPGHRPTWIEHSNSALMIITSTLTEPWSAPGRGSLTRP